jgi:hypothetical protein
MENHSEENLLSIEGMTRVFTIRHGGIVVARAKG